MEAPFHPDLLSGRTALVTGAAGGIGAAAVRGLELAGAAVVGVDSAPSYAGLVADVTDPSAMGAAVDAAGGLDICVANAGISLMEPLVEGDPAHWRSVLGVNLLGVMVTFQAAARAMVEHGRGGRLLAVSSLAGIRGEPHTAAYAASKAGLIGLVRALAVELAPYGITVNGVAPGQIETRLNDRDIATLARHAGRSAEELLREHLDRRVPAGRRGQPDEVAAALTFLASDAAGYITGEVVRIDGGEGAG